MNAISDSFIQKYDHFSKRNLGKVVFFVGEIASDKLNVLCRENDCK